MKGEEGRGEGEGKGEGWGDEKRGQRDADDDDDGGNSGRMPRGQRHRSTVVARAKPPHPTTTHHVISHWSHWQVSGATHVPPFRQSEEVEGWRGGEVGRWRGGESGQHQETGDGMDSSECRLSKQWRTGALWTLIELSLSSH